MKMRESMMTKSNPTSYGRNKKQMSIFVIIISCCHKRYLYILVAMSAYISLFRFARSMGNKMEV